MRSWLFFACLVLASLAVRAESQTVLAAANAYPPYMDPERSTGGLAVEIVRAAYKSQNYAFKLEVMPWARAELGVNEGRFDILLNVWRTELRAKTLLFSTPYAIGKVKFLKRKGDAFEFTGLDSLKGKRIGVVRGYGYGDAFNDSTLFVREEVSGLDLNIRKLVLQRIDLTLEDEITAKFVLSQTPTDVAQQVEFTHNALSENPLYIASGLKNPRHRELIEVFNKGFETIKANGVLAKIHKNYGLTL